jgi:8-oxo-dGTP pyrophosphatase MutT (NUDIX family)
MTQPSIPLPASTVVLIRPGGDGGFEIFLNRRPIEMNSYAGAYVFPGGRVEKSDYSEAMVSLTRGLTPREAQQKLGSHIQPELCLAHWVAAVRELFEESGIHFFASLNAAATDSLEAGLAERLADKRKALQRGEVDLPKLLVSERLYCNVARLIYFFHRVTPEHYAVRFDTRFYLAELPADQRPLHASEEVAESLWIAPAAALARAEAGNYHMLPPTIAVLRHLSAYKSWEELNQAFKLR